ncbi:MAG: hypothetical protein AAFX94_14230 [Myxococcota bacterium]
MRAFALTLAVAAALLTGSVAQAGDTYLETFTEELAERRAESRRKLDQAKAQQLVSLRQDRTRSRLFRYAVGAAKAPRLVSVAYLPLVDAVN